MSHGNTASALIATLALTTAATGQYAITSFTIDAALLAGATNTLSGGFWIPTPTTPPVCPGDIANNDGQIDVDDLNVILANFGATCG